PDEVAEQYGPDEDAYPPPSLEQAPAGQDGDHAESGHRQLGGRSHRRPALVPPRGAHAAPSRTAETMACSQLTMKRSSVPASTRRTPGIDVPTGGGGPSVAT